MNCPRCNVAVAFTKNRCDNCGQELRSYRKTVSLSNSFYNLALSQAKVRDLSGAIVSLKQSLQFNKLNTSARNLLGLIYYEEGEIVAALSEWVLSKHYQDKDNDAEEYIREVQSNPNKLDTYNQTIKKYNTALQAAKHGDDDMAIIQLKKVVNLNPNFIRASQLLALLYMKTERRDNRARAYRLMRAAHKIDVTNTTTIRYLKELSDMKNKSSDPVVKAVEKEQENAKKASKLPSVEMDAYKTITPYKEERPSVMPFVNIIIGVIIGLAVMYFLVIPHMRATLASNANKNFKQYSENQAASDSDLSTLKDQNKSLKSQVEELQNKIGEIKTQTPVYDFVSEDGIEHRVWVISEAADVAMIEEAFAKIPAETNLILHSDQGWQYQHKQYQQMLREKGVRQSMSRKGNCLDNAVIENFFGLLKSELLYLQEFRSMEHFKQELVAYLDYYNNRRIKAKLKGLPPAIHRQQALSAA